VGLRQKRKSTERVKERKENEENQYWNGRKYPEKLCEILGSIAAEVFSFFFNEK
jgi:hypothetical protein